MTAHRKPADEAAATFVRRHIGPSPRDIAAMLETVGAKSLDALMAETLPSSIRQQTTLDLGAALSETEALAHMSELASRNLVFTSLIGQGYSGTVLPAVIQCNILEDPAWYATCVRPSPCCTPRARLPSLPPTCWRSRFLPRPAISAPISRSDRRSASAFPWDMAGRMPPTWRCATR